MITKRHFLQTAAFAAAAFAAPRAFAIGNPSYPSRSVKWVVPYAAGGATDVLSRLLCQRLSDRLGQTFVVENKPGAGSNIGTQAVITSAPDGYTLLLTSTANAITPRSIRHCRMISPRASRRSRVSPEFPWCWSSTTTCR